MITLEKPIYTHIDRDGMLWRFEGARPVSELGDEVMRDVERQIQEADDEHKNRKTDAVRE